MPGVEDDQEHLERLPRGADASPPPGSPSPLAGRWLSQIFGVGSRDLNLVCLLLLLVLPGVAVVAFSASQQERWQSLAVATLLGLAGAAGGGLLGFVFGVPRMLAEGDQSGLLRSADASTIVANTNLEQISDWLTKILVGVGLTQFPAIVGAADSLFTGLAPAVGGGPAGKAFAGALLVYSAACGFAVGWLITRLQLARVMVQADRRAAEARLGLEMEHASEEKEDLRTDNQKKALESARDGSLQSSLDAQEEAVRLECRTLQTEAREEPALAIRGAWRLVRRTAKEALPGSAARYPDTPSRVIALSSQGLVPHTAVALTNRLRKSHDEVKAEPDHATTAIAQDFIDSAEELARSLRLAAMAMKSDTRS